MGLVKCTTAIENASYSVRVGEVVDTSSYLYARFPSSFSAQEVELDTLVAGAPTSAWTQTYSTANKTVANPTAAAHTYPASGNMFDAVAADLLINVRTDTLANAVADIVTNLKSIAENLNQVIADDLDNRQSITAIVDDGQTLGLFS